MKINRVKKTSILMLLAFVSLSSCDLELQDSYDYKPGLLSPPAPFNKTVFQFIQENPDEFSVLIDAISYTGLRSLYEEPVSSRTFFLIRNPGFTQLIEDKTGVKNSLNIRSLPVATVQNLLRYHIIDGKNLNVLSYKSTFVEEIHQTMVAGPSGLIAVERNERFRLLLNNSTQLPTTNTRKLLETFAVDYVFTNGIAHQLILYAQY